MKATLKLKLMGIVWLMSVIPSFSKVMDQPSRLIVVDQLMTNELTTITRTYPDDKLLVLPEKGNPLAAIAVELKNQAFDEVHIFVLTKPGSIVFDEMTILADNINDYLGDFRQWRDLSGNSTRIIIHSATLTSVPEGNSIVSKIADFTGKEVIVQQN